jgi:hypothetical protein
MERFTVSVHPVADGERWLNETRDRLARQTASTVARERDVEVGGKKGREIDFARDDRVMRARLFVVAGRSYEVVASAPAWGESQRRFLESFTLR